jgi:hypothetical protein
MRQPKLKAHRNVVVLNVQRLIDAATPLLTFKLLSPLDVQPFTAKIEGWVKNARSVLENNIDAPDVINEVLAHLEHHFANPNLLSTLNSVQEALRATVQALQNLPTRLILFDHPTLVPPISEDDKRALASLEIDRFNKMARSFSPTLNVSTPEKPVTKVLHLLDRFSRAAKHLKTRRAGRPALLMKDEHDVQYLLQALLDVHFDDVRPEEYGPSVAGKNVRIDFLLEAERIAVEAKMTRDNLRDKGIGDELLADIGRYKKHPDCKTLVCFVYDPEGLMRNPDGLEKDLTRMHDSLDVRVVVRPKH